MNVILCLNSFVRIFQRCQKALLWCKGLSECYFMSEQFCKNISKVSKGIIMG